MHSKPVITSPHNPFFKQCLLLRDNRKRRRSQQFLIDGQSEIVHAIDAGIEVHTLLVSESVDEFLLEQLCRDRPIAVQPFSRAIFEKLCFGQRDDQIVAVAQQSELSLHSLQLNANSLILVLDRTEKPGNLGACLRSAAACGVSAVVLTDPICDPFNANAIRASRGTMFRVPLAISSSGELQSTLRRLALPIFAARVDASRRLWDLPLKQGAALVFGNEAQGLGDNWQGESVSDFVIPMVSAADSLNLSISAAVTLYEACRQRLS